MCWNKIIGLSSGGSARVRFSLLLGSLAHDRRLRSDSYDPQRPGVLECGGCEGRSAPSLYCWYVWIGSLIHSVIAPTSRSIPKLQHYPAERRQIGALVWEGNDEQAAADSHVAKPE